VLDTDFGPFETAFKRLSGALNKKWTANEFRQVSRTYFDTLQHAPLEDVLAAETTLRARNRWPKTGDWIAALPRHAPTPAGQRVMRSGEADTYVRAIRKRYHDTPCGCLECLAAGVTDRELRFVPEFTADDVEERAYCPPLGRVVVTGHWAHGIELARWYQARQRFIDAVPARYTRVLALLPSREPGEEG
jgi:hypothetical protein